MSLVGIILVMIGIGVITAACLPTKLSAKSRINAVFVDFDGVLHPGDNETFTFLPSFQETLRHFPDVSIVIISDWRRTTGLNSLRSIFSEDFAHRVIGVTHVLNGAITVEREIMQFVQEHKINHFVAVDSRTTLYSPGWTHLLTTELDVGLNEERQQVLFNILATWYE